MTNAYKYLYWVIVSFIILGSILMWDHYRPPLAEKPSSEGVPILTYHKVNPDRNTGGFGLRVLPADFDWQMKYLKNNGYHSVSPGNVVDHFQTGSKLPDKPFVITFDDGYQDNYRYAWPILKKYNYTATVFIVPHIVGGINAYDYYANLQPENKMLTWQEIKEMNDAGITIGAHALDHASLTKVSPAEAQRQILESKKILEQKLGKEVRYFCYPYGDFNRNIAEMVKKSGYQAATSSEEGLVQANSDPYLLKRLRINGHLSHRMFVKKLHKY
ncbi:MAG: polysaccharide deacetylase [Firmicutes bacterium]|nr:polysaccharide deacetylase [Bacillota bacterium]